MKCGGNKGNEAGKILSHALAVYGRVTGQNHQEVCRVLSSSGVRTTDIPEFMEHITQTTTAFTHSK